MHSVSRVALITSLVLSAAPAFGRDVSGGLPAISTATPDVYALRYYAKLGDTERYQLEMDRLRRLYPTYRPPTNLGVDDSTYEQELWALIDEGQIEALHERIDEIGAGDPSWKPSEDLLRELDRRKARAQLLDAHKEFSIAEVKQLANDNPLLVNPDDPEVVWAIAETFALEGDLDSALEAFTFAVTTADSDEVKAGALQKAAQHLPIEHSAGLHVLAKVKHGDSEVDRLLDLGFARGLVIRANQFGTAFPEAYTDIVSLYMSDALDHSRLDDIEVLSWTLYNQRQYLQALALFQKSLEIQPDNKAVEGTLLSLKHLNRLAEARPIASQWRTASKDIARIFLTLWAPVLLDTKAGTFDAEFLQTFSQTTDEVTSGEGAEALGWYAYNVKQFVAAEAWFVKAMEWELTETSVLGRLLTAAARKDKPTFEALQASYAVQYPGLSKHKYEPVFARARTAAPRKRSKTRSQSVSQAMTAAHKAKNYQRCVELSDQLIRSGRMAAHDYQMRGWCLMQMQRPAEAQLAFEQAVKTDPKSGKDRNASAYGASLAALRAGRTDAAFQIAESNTLDSGQRRIVDKEILTQRAMTAFRKRDYRSTLFALNQLREIAQEPMDLSHLRGWSLYYLGDYRGALSVFESLDSIYSTADTRRALQIIRRRAQRG